MINKQNILCIQALIGFPQALLSVGSELIPTPCRLNRAPASEVWFPKVCIPCHTLEGRTIPVTVRKGQRIRSILNQLNKVIPPGSGIYRQLLLGQDPLLPSQRIIEILEQIGTTGLTVMDGDPLNPLKSQLLAILEEVQVKLDQSNLAASRLSDLKALIQRFQEAHATGIGFGEISLESQWINIMKQSSSQSGALQAMRVRLHRQTTNEACDQVELELDHSCSPAPDRVTIEIFKSQTSITVLEAVHGVTFETNLTPLETTLQLSAYLLDAISNYHDLFSCCIS